MIMQHERFRGFIAKTEISGSNPESRKESMACSRTGSAPALRHSGVKSVGNTPVTHLIQAITAPWQETKEAQMGGTYRGTFSL